MLKKQNLYNKIIITLIMVLTISFITPNYSHASVKSALTDAFQTIVCYLGDGIINVEQRIFTGQSAILDIKSTERCNIKYGVATIVSGTLDFFNINFFTNQGPTYVEEEEYESAFLRSIFPQVRDELSKLVDDFNNGNLADKSNDTLIYNMENILTKTRYRDTSNEADANGYTRSFSALLGNNWNNLDIESAWNEVYPNENYYTSDFYKVFVKGSTDTGNVNGTSVSYYTLLSKYFNGTEVKKDELINLFEKINPVIQKVYESNLTKIEVKTAASTLAPTIRKWYVVLRNFALVLLLSVLVYMGIKIVISSTANDTAKYKEKIVNVLVAICLLFVMQYIMSLTMYIVDVINDSIGVNIISENGSDILMSEVRTKAEISKSTNRVLAYTVIYAVLVWYTVIFTIMYIKRILTIILLTIFAPLVTVTYPLDKEKDGKSQAFNFWLKEYMFNILIQPVHLLLYYVFVTMAIDLVKGGNFFWAIIALFFMRRAEKIMRKMFKLDDSSTLTEFGSFASGAALTSALRKVGNKAVKGKKKGKEKSDTSKSDNNIRTKDINDTFADDDSNSDNIRQSEDRSDNKDDKPKDKQASDKKTNNQNNQNANTKINDKKQSKQKVNEDKLKKDFKNRNKKSVVRGIKKVGKRTFSGKNIAKVAKGVGKVGLGAAGLTMGIGAGIATGDLNNVFKYGASGAVAGIGSVEALSSGLSSIGNAGKALKQEATAIGDEYKVAYNNYTQKEYEQNILIPRMKKENAKNKEIQEKYISELGSKEFLKSSARDELYDAGITDEDMIIKALKLQQEQGVSDEKLVQNAVIASKVKEYKDLELREKQLREILENTGLNNEKIDEEVKNRMKMISKLSGMN